MDRTKVCPFVTAHILRSPNQGRAKRPKPRSSRINALLTDPWVDATEADAEYDVKTIDQPQNGQYDAVVLAVAHDEFIMLGADAICGFGKPESVLFDVKHALPADKVTARL